jgi:NhaP-type Na+/H+ and K+/H+ antiporter
MSRLLLWLMLTVACVSVVAILGSPLAAGMLFLPRFCLAFVVGTIGGVAIVQLFDALVNLVAQRLLTGRG